MAVNLCNSITIVVVHTMYVPTSKTSSHDTYEKIPLYSVAFFFFLYECRALLDSLLGSQNSSIKQRFFLFLNLKWLSGKVQSWHHQWYSTSWYSPSGVRYCKISLCCMPSVRGERENDIGITWYPPLGTHIALPEERAILFGFTSGEDLVGSKLLPTMQRTV